MIQDFKRELFKKRLKYENLTKWDKTSLEENEMMKGTAFEPQTGGGEIGVWITGINPT